MLGFTIRKDEELEGFQIVTCNGMTISMWGLGASDDSAVQFNECAVAIGKPLEGFENMPSEMDMPMALFDTHPVENITPVVMEKMGYIPSAREIESQIFVTNINKYFEIVEFVKKLGV